MDKNKNIKINIFDNLFELKESKMNGRKRNVEDCEKRLQEAKEKWPELYGK